MSIRKILDANGDVIREVVCADDGHHDIQGFHVTQDCTSIVEYVSALRDNLERRRDRPGRVLAEVPISFADEWFRTGAIHDQAYLRRWVNDPANRDFVVEGKA